MKLCNGAESESRTNCGTGTERRWNMHQTVGSQELDIVQGLGKVDIIRLFDQTQLIGTDNGSSLQAIQ